MIRPANFGFNPETAASNAFQKPIEKDAQTISQTAIREFDAAVENLRASGVSVIVCNDSLSSVKTDAVFPNNWISFHADGTLVLYPMLSANRRLERRADIIDSLKHKFKITDIIDLTNHERENRFLEGTGSVVFDHANKLAYAALSPRTDLSVLLTLCKHLAYEPVVFRACDENGVEIYHTNVMMCVGEQFAVVCLESITNGDERAGVIDQLRSSGHEIVDITFAQMNAFAGNMLELRSNDGQNLLVLSQTAFESLTATQKNELTKYCEFVPVDIPTIETVGGGSARCMIAEIFLPPALPERP
jgi:hypothetical protein